MGLISMPSERKVQAVEEKELKADMLSELRKINEILAALKQHFKHRDKVNVPVLLDSLHEARYRVRNVVIDITNGNETIDIRPGVHRKDAIDDSI